MRDRLALMVYVFFRTRWIPLVLLVSIVFIVAGCIVNAAWVTDSSPLVKNLILGSLCAALLAGSRWRGRAASIYSVFVSIAITLQEIGRVLPAWSELGSLPLPDTVWVMHLRSLTLGERVLGWSDAWNKGTPITDTGLFVLLTGVILWNVSAWLVWWVMRRQNALAGLIPIAVMLAINVHLHRQPPAAFALFIFCAVLLIAYTAFVRQHRDWQARGIDFPDMLGEDWALGTCGLAILVAALAWGAPLIGTPEGWQALAELIRPVQQQAAATSQQLFTNVNQLPDFPVGPSIETPNLSHIGAPPSQGADTIMWVSTSDPPPSPPQAGMYGSNPPQHYWAGQILEKYDGQGWTPADTSTFEPAHDLQQSQVSSHTELQQHFEIVARHGDTIFAASFPISASQTVDLRFSPGGDTAILTGTVSTYDVASEVPRVSGAELARASTAYPADIAAAYLQLPDTLPARVRALAARLVEGAKNPYDKALRIQDYLRLTYPYKLDVPAPPANRDAVDYFLFEAPGGFCTYYASAMAVMLRTQGVPVRVVSGYAMGNYDFTRHAYRVPASAAHAWVQAYFPGYGWIEFEPTPSQNTFNYQDRPTTPLDSNATPQVKNADAPWANALPIAGVLALLSLSGVALYLGLRVEWRGRTSRRQIQLSYWRLRRVLAWVGLAARVSSTPYEFLEANAPVLASHVRLQQALDQTTGLYLRAMFSPQPLQAEEIKQAHHSIWRALNDWLSLAVHALGVSIRRLFRENV